MFSKFATWVPVTNTDSWVPPQNSSQSLQDQSSLENTKLELGLSLLLVPNNLRNPERINFFKRVSFSPNVELCHHARAPHLLSDGISSASAKMKIDMK